MFFSDFFGVERDTIETYGAFDISLVADVPLFIDPFLIFNSKKQDYRDLHEAIIRYVLYVHDKVEAGEMTDGLARALLYFPEIKQNWFGYSAFGNEGHGLGREFAEGLRRNIRHVKPEDASAGIHVHLEKLCLIEGGVGRDSISDFTTNLIVHFLASFTEKFAKAHLAPEDCKTVAIAKARFNYETESWEADTYCLPWLGDDFVLLTPTDVLTKDENWLNRPELIESLPHIVQAADNEELRAKLSNYLQRRIGDHGRRKKLKQSEIRRIHADAVREHPEIVDHYIAQKEATGDEAKKVAHDRVDQGRSLYVLAADALAQMLGMVGFYGEPANTYDSTMARVHYFKDVIENKGGHRVFYVKGQPIKKEVDAQIVFRFTWFGTRHDVTTEANDGRGPVDYKVSNGAADKSLVEFKLARNTQLERNLKKQTAIYQKASNARRAIIVILFFTGPEERKVQRILKRMGIDNCPHVVLVDARKDNKPSGSKA